MKTKLLLIGVFMMLLTGCQSTKTTAETGSEKDLVLNTRIDQWTKAISKKKLDGFYSRNFAIFTHESKVLRDEKDVSEYYSNLFSPDNKIIEVLPKYRINAGIKFVYEIGDYVAKNTSYSYVLIWEKKGANWVKEMEVISEKSPNLNYPLDEVDNARLKWADVSMANDPDKLVDEVYQKKCYYFTRGKLINNPASLKIEFAYMKYDGVDIEGEFTYRVNENIVYDIGNYNTNNSYFGYYIIVWEKDSEGQWKAFLDANI